MNRRTNDAGFTLVEMVIAVTLFGLLAIIAGNIFMTVSHTFHTVASGSNDLNTITLTARKIEKDARNAVTTAASEDGRTLTLTDAAGKNTVWTMTDRGLSNGTYIAEGVTSASFSVSRRFVRFTLGEGATTVARTVHPRLTPPDDQEGAGAPLTVGGEWIHQDE